MVCAVIGIFIGGIVGFSICALFSYNSYEKGYNDAMKKVHRRLEEIWQRSRN